MKEINSYFCNRIGCASENSELTPVFYRLSILSDYPSPWHSSSKLDSAHMA